MNINKNYLKSNFNFIICLIISLTITSTCMLLINIHSNLNSITASNNNSTYALVCNNINSINSTLNNCIADTSINMKSAESLLTNGLKDLNNCRSSLPQENIKKDESLVDDLVLSIDSTTDLYTYCLNYISTYEETPVDQLVTDLDTLKSTCSTAYSKMNDYGLSLNYPNNLDNFLTAFVTYYSKINQLKIQTQIKDTQISQFKSTLTTICTDFSNLLEDLQPAIDRIHEENRSFDTLLEDLNTKEENFSSLKRKLNNASIPEGYLSYYTNLNDIFTLYSSYLNNLRTAIIYERSSATSKDNLTTINKNYDNAFNKYTSVKESITEFLSELENS